MIAGIWAAEISLIFNLNLAAVLINLSTCEYSTQKFPRLIKIKGLFLIQWHRLD